MSAALIRPFFEDADSYTEHTLLMSAAVRRDAGAVKLYLRQAKQQDNDGRSALALAVLNGHLECVELLVESEAGMKDNLGCTALMHAARRNFLEAAELLVKHEAGLQCSLGWTALAWAVEGNSVQMIELLLDIPGERAGLDALIRAVLLANEDVVTRVAKYYQRPELQEAGRWAIAGGRQQLLPILNC